MLFASFVWWFTTIYFCLHLLHTYARPSSSSSYAQLFCSVVVVPRGHGLKTLVTPTSAAAAASELDFYFAVMCVGSSSGFLLNFYHLFLTKPPFFIALLLLKVRFSVTFSLSLSIYRGFFRFCFFSLRTSVSFINDRLPKGSLLL